MSTCKSTAATEKNILRPAYNFRTKICFVFAQFSLCRVITVNVVLCERLSSGLGLGLGADVWGQ